MAITDAQQAKQILMKKGGPVHRHQLAKKRKDGKRPGYYGPDYGHTSDPGTDFGKDAYSGGPSNIDMVVDQVVQIKILTEQDGL